MQTKQNYVKLIRIVYGHTIGKFQSECQPTIVADTGEQVIPMPQQTLANYGFLQDSKYVCRATINTTDYFDYVFLQTKPSRVILRPLLSHLLVVKMLWYLQHGDDAQVLDMLKFFGIETDTDSVSKVSGNSQTVNTSKPSSVKQCISKILYILNKWLSVAIDTKNLSTTQKDDVKIYRDRFKAATSGLDCNHLDAWIKRSKHDYVPSTSVVVIRQVVLASGARNRLIHYVECAVTVQTLWDLFGKRFFSYTTALTKLAVDYRLIRSVRLQERCEYYWKPVWKDDRFTLTRVPTSSVTDDLKLLKFDHLPGFLVFCDPETLLVPEQFVQTVAASAHLFQRKSAASAHLSHRELATKECADSLREEQQKNHSFEKNPFVQTVLDATHNGNDTKQTFSHYPAATLTRLFEHQHWDLLHTYYAVTDTALFGQKEMLLLYYIGLMPPLSQRSFQERVINQLWATIRAKRSKVKKIKDDFKEIYYGHCDKVVFLSAADANSKPSKKSGASEITSSFLDSFDDSVAKDVDLLLNFENISNKGTGVGGGNSLSQSTRSMLKSDVHILKRSLIQQIQLIIYERSQNKYADDNCFIDPSILCLPFGYTFSKSLPEQIKFTRYISQQSYYLQDLKISKFVESFIVCHDYNDVDLFASKYVGCSSKRIVKVCLQPSQKQKIIRKTISDYLADRSLSVLLLNTINYADRLCNGQVLLLLPTETDLTRDLLIIMTLFSRMTMNQVAAIIECSESAICYQLTSDTFLLDSMRHKLHKSIGLNPREVVCDVLFFKKKSLMTAHLQELLNSTSNHSGNSSIATNAKTASLDKSASSSSQGKESPQKTLNINKNWAMRLSNKTIIYDLIIIENIHQIPRTKLVSLANILTNKYLFVFKKPYYDLVGAIDLKELSCILSSYFLRQIAALLSIQKVTQCKSVRFQGCFHQTISERCITLTPEQQKRFKRLVEADDLNEISKFSRTDDVFARFVADVNVLIAKKRKNDKYIIVVETNVQKSTIKKELEIESFNYDKWISASTTETVSVINIGVIHKLLKIDDDFTIVCRSYSKAQIQEISFSCNIKLICFGLDWSIFPTANASFVD